MKLVHKILIGVAAGALMAMPLSLPAQAAEAQDPGVTTIPSPPPGATPVTFGYTGAVEEYTVGDGVGWVLITAIGGPGGMDTAYTGGSQSAEVSGTVKVSPGDVLSLSVAAAGGQQNGGWTAGGPGGWGGLGASGGDGAESDDSLRDSGAGGGASTVQLISGSVTTTLIVAGGGGGHGGASGDPDHAGDGGDGGDNGWTGGDGDHGTEGSTGGGGGKGGAAATSAGDAGLHGTGLGGNGGAGGGGLHGGTAGSGGHLSSAGGGGGAGSSYANPDLVLDVTVKRSGVRWRNVQGWPDQPVPNGSIVVTPIPRLTTTVDLAVQNSRVEVGANAGPLSAVIASVDGYAPSGAVDFYDVTDGTGPQAVSLGSATVTNGVGAIPSAVFTSAGTRTLQAVWSGDPNYAPESSGTVAVTVTSAVDGSGPGGGGSGPGGGSSAPPAAGAGGSSGAVGSGAASTTRLANTGADLGPGLAISAALLLAGLASLALSRRAARRHYAE